MIVCSCRSVSDRVLRDALASGASPDDIIRQTRAGSDCGHCRSQIDSILKGDDDEGCCGGPCATCPRRGAA